VNGEDGAMKDERGKGDGRQHGWVSRVLSLHTNFTSDAPVVL